MALRAHRLASGARAWALTAATLGVYQRRNFSFQVKNHAPCDILLCRTVHGWKKERNALRNLTRLNAHFKHRLQARMPYFLLGMSIFQKL